MQRWQLTTLLAGGAILAAVLAPHLKDAISSGHAAVNLISTTPDVSQLKPAGPTAPSAEDAALEGLKIRAGLDRSAVLAGVDEERYVVITLEGQDAKTTQDAPVNVAVVMDRSGSMGGQGKISYARQAARELVEALDRDDRFSLVTFSDQSRVVVPSTQVTEPGRLLSTINALEAGGGTNLYDGINDGLDEVLAHLDGESVNRVIVLSDGHANMGITSESALVDLSSRWTERGISVSTMGVGLDYNEDLLAEMADWGGGTYRFIDDPSVLAGVFRDELDQLSSLAARSVSVDLTMAPGVELVDVIGYSERIEGDTARVWVGDVQAGETRKVVARVRVPAGDSEIPVAAIQVSHTEGAAAMALSAMASTDAGFIAGSVDRELAVLATQAEASALADQATRAYEDGDRDRMRSLMRASQQIAQDASTRYNAPALQAQSAALKQQEDAFEAASEGSRESYFQVKRAKEEARAYSH